MEELVTIINEINEIIHVLKIDMMKSTKGNFLASKRARVNSVKLAKLLKQYRVTSMQELK